MTQQLLILFHPDVYICLLFLAVAIVTVVAWRMMRAARQRWVRPTVITLLATLWLLAFYGTFLGVTGVRVRHVTFFSDDLPPAFDGYRIVQFSDAHVGSFNGWRKQILQEAVDSITAQQADMIVFTGDLQNTCPADIDPHRRLLATLKAPDGVFSVLGNHDYAMYVDQDLEQQYRQVTQTCNEEGDLGWTLLNNDHRIIRRGADSLVIAGMENDGENRFPQYGRINSALYGLRRQSFVVMLEHDPTAWRRKILPHSHCQLTLSGHTHGGQISLLGLSPAALTYHEYSGLYYVGNRAINVSSGIGGVIPFRIGTPPEIVVVTLARGKKL